jgi:protein involved in polysaccharide export with SLBB domain
MAALASLPPFGASLFDRRVAAGGQSPGPNYEIAIGDQIAVKVWGSVEADILAAVDPQGQIFIPNIGPVEVLGVRNGELTSHITRSIRTTYLDNVAVYATMVAWRSMGVFVTGYVARPGRYPSTAAESVIDLLAKAGGIDPERGSYRDVRVLRDGKTIATIDLYDFLINGTLPRLQLQEGDTIVVAAQGPTLAVGGSVRNDFRFEFPPGNELTGADIIALARPLPEATHALIAGARDGRPYTDYVSLDEFSLRLLRDQDRVLIEADAARRELTVWVSGANEGPSVFVADPDTTLRQLLHYIEVDPQLADISAIHIRRRSVALQQKQSLEASLDRLERSLYSATVATDGEAQIRRAEAELVAKYIARARTVEPDGTVVVVDSDGRLMDLRLEDGDEIVIPERRSIVLVSGEVFAPQALGFEPGETARHYISRAGGYTDRGDQGKVIIRRPNGQVVIASLSTPVQPGDEVIAPPRVDFKTFQFTKDVTQILYQIAISAGVLIGL